jgi:hypothetical protein
LFYDTRHESIPGSTTDTVPVEIQTDGNDIKGNLVHNALHERWYDDVSVSNYATNHREDCRVLWKNFPSYNETLSLQSKKASKYNGQSQISDLEDYDYNVKSDDSNDEDYEANSSSKKRKLANKQTSTKSLGKKAKIYRQKAQELEEQQQQIVQLQNTQQNTDEFEMIVNQFFVDDEFELPLSFSSCSTIDDCDIFKDGIFQFFD